MGVYDFLKGSCPACGAIIGMEKGRETGDIQIKWFSSMADGECFRTFWPGNKLPDPVKDGRYFVSEVTPCCEKEVGLYAVVHSGRFWAFPSLTVARAMTSSSSST